MPLRKNPAVPWTLLTIKTLVQSLGTPFGLISPCENLPMVKNDDTDGRTHLCSVFIVIFDRKATLRGRKCSEALLSR